MAFLTFLLILCFLEFKSYNAFLLDPFRSIIRNTRISQQISISKLKETRVFAGNTVFSPVKLTAPSRRRSKRMQTKSKSVSTPSRTKKDNRSRGKEAMKPSSLASTSGNEQLQKTGRVSVYCVGSSIDLEGLRGYIFRKSFGNEGRSSTVGDKNEEASTSISRIQFTRASINDYDKDPEIDDDDVFHVTNAPLVISPLINKEEKKADDPSSLLSSSSAASSSSSTLPTSQQSNMDWKTKEVLLMSLQDIFYFGYGCVVFWGLTKNEEKIALNELLPFVNEPVTTIELEDSHDDDEFYLERPSISDMIGDGRGGEGEEESHQGSSDETAEERDGVSRGSNSASSGSSPNSNNPTHWSFDGIKLTSLARVEKLTYSYALAQSSKLFVLESKVDESIEGTRSLPKELAKTGKISSYKKSELNKLIGQLFVEQTEVNLFSSILDTPGMCVLVYLILF
jgi:uncharacterized Rmd1/YagE family protein